MRQSKKEFYPDGFDEKGEPKGPRTMVLLFDIPNLKRWDAMTEEEKVLARDNIENFKGQLLAIQNDLCPLQDTPSLPKPQEGKYFHCQREIEDAGRCESVCDHCREYYAPLAQLSLPKQEGDDDLPDDVGAWATDYIGMEELWKEFHGETTEEDMPGSPVLFKYHFGLLMRKVMTAIRADRKKFSIKQPFPMQLEEDIDPLTELIELRGLFHEVLVRAGIGLPAHEETVDLFDKGFANEPELMIAIHEMLFDDNEITSEPKLSTLRPVLTDPSPKQEGDRPLFQRIIEAQIGTREVSDAIEEHMKEYFTRFASYQDRFTYLEWYHIFLDFSDSLDRRKKLPSPKQEEPICGECEMPTPVHSPFCSQQEPDGPIEGKKTLEERFADHDHDSMLWHIAIRDQHLREANAQIEALIHSTEGWEGQYYQAEENIEALTSQIKAFESDAIQYQHRIAVLEKELEGTRLALRNAIDQNVWLVDQRDKAYPDYKELQKELSEVYNKIEDLHKWHMSHI